MRCYSDELDRLRMPVVAEAAVPSVLARAPRFVLRVVRGGARRGMALGTRLLGGAGRSPRVEPSPAPTRDARCDEALAREISLIAPYAAPSRSVPRVVHVIGSLAAGGAERQLVYLARETVRRGAAEARVLLTNPLTGPAAHYLPLAQEGGVTVEVSGANPDPATMRMLAEDAAFQRRLAELDPCFRGWVVDLACEFVRLRPDIVHAWLDHANVWSGIAALIAGVPRIVLSTRNVNPSHFPMIDAPYFRSWYRRLAEHGRVSLIANSRVGAEDYAAWMQVDRARFTVIPNGFDPAAMQVPNDAARAALRAELGVEGKRVVLGVFRLAEEKEPMDFASAAEVVLRNAPDACVLVAGDGPLRSALERRAAQIGPERFRVLGRRDDIAALISIADVTMHASRKEGTPNALLEAQALGCPVVATRGGGTVDAVEHEGSGFLCDVGDTDALSRHVLEVLADDALRARLSSRARAFVTERFGLQRMVDESIAMYAREERG